MSAVAAAARGMLGVRFRAQGRGREGVDCVGLAAVALRAGGFSGVVPRGYRLRGGDPVRVAAMLDGMLARGDGKAAGDVLLCASGPGQLHLAIRVEDGVIHADAGLGRVVERPGVVPWPVLGAWRIGA
ncbi:peptidoglycan endopeptidase [Sphingomonas sp.]|uniref:peptidoglycan endopeptidase n=1 Tax=Sphingomonas sp. TaxID=28214 RepID=UPI0035BC7F72